MFKESPYKVSLESFQNLKIETEKELNEVYLEQAGKLHKLDIVKKDFGFYADISSTVVDLQSELFVHLENKYKQNIEVGLITTSQEFDDRYSSSLELGAIYSKEQTIFRVWSPVASSLTVVVNNEIYAQAIGDGKHYEVSVDGDLEGLEYYYLVCINGKIHKVVDPYALNVSLNTSAGIIINRDKYLFTGSYNQNDKSKMTIYETSVCDFTSDTSADFKFPGKYVGFNQSQTIGNQKIGIDYVDDLGVSHIQLMPIYDFGSVNEQISADNNYNWGYDPIHYNVPEGSYVQGTDFDSRIVECKEMISQIKERNIGVIMDVVYNHVYEASGFNYNLLVPNYYFRFSDSGQLADASFCGNEVASERTMVRRYIVDTLVNWVEIYGIDGLRIDLMGIMDIPTIGAIETTLKQINPHIIIYGEGWNMNSQLVDDVRATQMNANKLPNVGYFNDDFRNFIKGDNSDFDKIGYVQGNRDSKKLACVLNGQPLDEKKKYVNEFQLINYLSCHDDHTLYDYLKVREENEIEVTKQIVEAYQLLFTAKGIPFIHSGCEFKRTKNGLKNTYNSPRQLNSIKWNQVVDNHEIISEIKALISRRKDD